MPSLRRASFSLQWSSERARDAPHRRRGMIRSGRVPPDDRDRRAHAEAALHSGEPSYRLIVDTMPALIAIMTPEGEVEHVNGQVREYFGRTLDELKTWGFAAPLANNRVFDGKGLPVPFAGQITTLSTNPRQLQLGLKLTW